MGRVPIALALALLTLCLAACGGGGQSAGTSASSPPTTAPAPEGAAAQGPQSSAAKPKQGGAPPLPPPTPGSKAPAPGVPTSKGGDDSIQTYGVEGSDTERAEASALVRAYLSARAAGNWGKVCSQLAAKPRAEQSRFAKGAQSCAAAMASFAAEASGAVLREEAQIEVLSLRVGPRFAFLIYRRPDRSVWATALERGGGGWKVLSVTPAALG
jgi:hypothetical protein